MLFRSVCATVRQLGLGRIAGVYFDFGQSYISSRTTISQQFLQDMVEALFPNPIVKINGNPNIEVVLRQRGDELLINLINLNGPHDNETVCVYDDIPAVLDISMAINVGDEPSSVILAPENIEMDFSYENGVIKLVVPEVKIHQIIVVKRR